MKTQTKAVKKKAVKSLPRETMMSKSDKANSIDAMRSDRAYKLGRSDERFSYTEYGSAYRRQREALQRAQKQNRELKKKVDKLHATIGFLLTQ
jgi:hypothetical protein